MNWTDYQDEARRHPYPLIFLTVSGAHLYGFASADSDVDLRGAHLLPLEEVVGLSQPEETVESSHERDGVPMDMVSHDVKKFFSLLLKPNGYVLEQLYSPLVVQTSSAHEELLTIAQGCFTKWHVKHYQGFSRNQWNLFQKENPPGVKPLLYVYRVLLTGIHLMRTGELESNLVRLNEHFNLPQVPDLIRQKTEGGEKQRLSESDLAFHEKEFTRLDEELEQASETSPLPQENTARAALDDLLIRLRISGVVGVCHE